MAGIAALVVSANPGLSAPQVKDILRRSTDKIEDPRTDEMTGLAYGRYDSRGHSRWFGHGKVNAESAVQEAVRRKRQR